MGKRFVATVVAFLMLVVGAPVALAHHCATSGGGRLCVGDPRNPDHVGEFRIAGEDRYATSVKISQTFWEPGEAANVYLTNGQTLVDALAAGASVNGPILVVPSGTTLPNVVKEELARLAPSNAVIALGGEGAIHPAQLHAASIAAGFPREATP